MKPAFYDSPNQLSKNLKELRQSYGLTQEVFAEWVGMKYKHYQDLEAGRKNNLQLKTLDRIAALLQIPSNVLIGSDGPAKIGSYVFSGDKKLLKAAEDPSNSFRNNSS